MFVYDHLLPDNLLTDFEAFLFVMYEKTKETFAIKQKKGLSLFFLEMPIHYAMRNSNQSVKGSFCANNVIFHSEN